MKVVTLARKPMSTSAATCVVEWGTGSLNIGGARVGAGPGRWPSNLILQHEASCKVVGERTVRSGVAVRENSGGKTIFSETDKPPMENMSYGEGGKETMPDWRCTDGCPVPDLDQQSGITTSKGHTRNNKGSWKVRKKGNTTASVDTPHSDTGGASRFFKQVKP